MTKITGAVKQFKNMFEVIMCGNKYPLFSTVILEISEETISVNAMDQTGAIGTNQEYTGFRIEGGADIPIDTASIYDAIKLFNDSDLLNFIYEDNKIVLSVISENKHDTITIPTLKIDEINNTTRIKFTNDSIIVGENEMNFNAHATVNSSYIQDQIKRATFVNALYHEYGVNIIDGSKLILTIGDPLNYETSSSTEINIDGSGTAQSFYAHGYDDIFKSLNGEIVIRINDNRPMLVVQTTDDHSVRFLIAPTIRE